ncbi:MAG: UDP-N-acetylmuramoyl-tripeptide--D-alanyl-D-alanine ligase [Candidatus Hydrogenedentes bacterium]|nr:UDP-N-acetylmuramoyl-tripeptide--D-alanyl-D-alanine ligase [Candidatus Hydrogenedentota bacterium]
MPWTYTLEDLGHILGVPHSGTASCAFQSVSTDSRTLVPGQVFFALSGEKFDGSQFVGEAFAKGAAAAVTTRARDGGPCCVVPDVLQALQRFAAHHRRQYRPLVLAITGSCGKTTSKDFVAAVLGSRMKTIKTQGNLNNEIGCPLSLLQIDDGTEAAVIEMGAARLGNIRELCELAKPAESAITLVAPSHLAGFGSIENVAATKAEIAEALPPDGVFYVNIDDPWCTWASERFPGEKVRYGSAGDVVLESCAFDANGEMTLNVHPAGELHLPLACRAHATNVLLAIAVGLRHGITDFEGPLREAAANRVRFKIRTVGVIEAIDDTYNASPVSMAASLEGLAERPASGRKFAALGDMLELGPDAARLHQEVGELAGRLGLDAVFARGDHASVMIEAARRSGVPHAEVIQDPQSMAAAIHGISGPGDVLLVKGSRGMRMERVIEALASMHH